MSIGYVIAIIIVAILVIILIVKLAGGKKIAPKSEGSTSPTETSIPSENSPGPDNPEAQ
jgi:hypothetical protein